jgi:tRNA-specific 2-thiouridylase
MRQETDLVAVAMSGGVDSSVAAHLLVRGGTSCMGMTMRLWSPDEDCGGERSCCGVDAAQDAKRVCARIGIPHYTLDLRHDFLHAVVDPFVADYLAGRTPNPCVRCNTVLKWGKLWERATAAGASRIATGHYARILRDENGDWQLRRGMDPSKDQSYFLWGIPRALLSRTLFPLGDLVKSDTRALAREASLPTAEKTESQDICFVPGGDYRTLVHARAGLDEPLLHPGPIVGPGGKVLGVHEGLANYTVGQRRGVKVAWSEPLYVTGLDTESNTLHLGVAADLLTSRLELVDENWLVNRPEELSGLSVQVRYRGTAVPCGLEQGESGMIVRLASPVSRPALGQSMVVYRNDQVIGGGVLLASE